MGDMEIKHPRRILVLGAPGLDVSRFLKDLTGSAPQPDTSGSFAGVTHEWSIQTAYYTANVPVWIDEVADVEQWKNEFLKPEAKEVIEAVAAWIYCFSRPAGATTEQISETVEKAMKAIEEIIEQACGYTWDGIRLALDMSPEQLAETEVVEEQCMEHSFEYIHADATGRNEFGEPVGIARVKEALETNDWNGHSLDESDHEDTIGDLDAEKAQMNSELWGFKTSLLDPDDDDENGHDDEEFQVDHLDQMMSQLLAIKETTSGMPEHERQAFASRAVNSLMKDL